MLSPLADLIEEIDNTGLAGDEAKELLDILKNPAKLENNGNDNFELNNAFLMTKRLKKCEKNSEMISPTKLKK